MTTKMKAKPATTAKPVPPKREEGLWGIVKGSRKEAVAIALDKNGKSAAIDQGNALGLSAATVVSWIRFWIKSGLVKAESAEAAKSKSTTRSDRKSKDKLTAENGKPDQTQAAA